LRDDEVEAHQLPDYARTFHLSRIRYPRLADLELPDAGIEQLGRGLGTFLRRNKGRRVNVGRDVRLSSPRLHDAIVRGLRASGCDVTSIGAAPTPLLYYSVHHLAADGGVMITGSHNPPEYNGFKTMMGDGPFTARDSGGRAHRPRRGL